MSSGFMDIPRDTPVVQVHTTSGRGATPEEIAARCADKLIHVPTHADQEAHDRALEVKNRITTLVAHYISEAIKSDRAMVCSKLDAAGHTDIVELIRSF